MDEYAFVFWPIFAGIQKHLNLVEVKNIDYIFHFYLLFLLVLL
jgi:hypothetical protein